MSSCQQKNVVVDYFFNELTKEQKAHYERHLTKCAPCQHHLADIKATARAMKQYQREQPDKILLQNYHAQLETQFLPARKKSTVIEKAIELIFRRPSIPIRLAEATILLLLGIFIGRNFMLKSELPLLSLRQSSSSEALLLKNYLQETEMVLLDVSNLDPIEDQKVIFNLIQSTKYRYLLQKTALLKNQASEQEDSQLIELLNQIELILLELSNLKEHAYPATIDEIKHHLKQSYLLMELRSINRQEI